MEGCTALNASNGDCRKKKKNLKEQGKGESSQTEEHGKKLPNEKWELLNS